MEWHEDDICGSKIASRLYPLVISSECIEHTRSPVFFLLAGMAWPRLAVHRVWYADKPAWLFFERELVRLFPLGPELIDRQSAYDWLRLKTPVRAYIAADALDLRSQQIPVIAQRRLFAGPGTDWHKAANDRWREARKVNDALMENVRRPAGGLEADAQLAYRVRQLAGKDPVYVLLRRKALRTTAVSQGLSRFTRMHTT